MVALIIVLVVIVLLVAIIIGTYNSLVKLNERVNEAWSDITVQLKYRADLVPNLVETVKGYATHEKDVFAEVTKARSEVMSAKGVKNTAEAERGLENALSRVFAIAEAYPELKANTNFAELQTQLQDVEDKIQAARRFYNAGAKSLNTKLKTFPSNVINNAVGHFEPREYYEVADSVERAKIEKAPEVKF